jgi:beta-glucosidase
MPCVVLVVSGRPMTIADQLPEIDGLVASWLPGSEGEGVADTLFGNAPFTGQLPQTWPSSLGQEPINVGDSTYNPQFPFGWGLRTSSARDDTWAAGQALDSGRTRGASERLRRLAGQRRLWRRDGAARDPRALVQALRRAAGGLQGASFAQQEAVLAIARDVVQAQIIADGGPNATTSPLVADADQALVGGHANRALALLARASSAAAA